MNIYCKFQPFLNVKNWIMCICKVLKRPCGYSKCYKQYVLSIKYNVMKSWWIKNMDTKVKVFHCLLYLWFVWYIHIMWSSSSVWTPLQNVYKIAIIFDYMSCEKEITVFQVIDFMDHKGKMVWSLSDPKIRQQQHVTYYHVPLFCHQKLN